MSDLRELCQALLNSDDWLILDTETTGIHSLAEACQIGVLAPSGKVLLDTLVNPMTSIPRAVTEIHGITDLDVRNAPLFSDLVPELSRLLDNKKIVAYNADFDRRILGQSSSISKILNGASFGSQREARAWMSRFEFIDIMNPYAKFWGDWNRRYGSYRWQKLADACRQQGVPVPAKHRAIDDCRLVLALIRKIGQVEDTEESKDASTISS